MPPRDAAKGGGKHAERAARMGKISDRKFQKFFCSTFCTLQKVEKVAAGRRSVAAGNTKRRHGRREMPPMAAKSTRSVLPRMGQRLFCPTFCALQKVEKSCRRAAQRPRSGKEFNYVRAKPPLRRAESRFGKPRCSLQRERVVTFCVVQKVT